MRVAGLDPGLRVAGLAVAERVGVGWWRLLGAEALPAGELAGRLAGILRVGVCAAGVDAPLHPQPPGGFRPVERAALRLGARLLPGWGAMARLTRLGMALAALLQEAGVAPVETHPSSAARIAGIPRGAGGLGRHEWEAALAAAAAAAWVDGLALEVEGPGGCLVFPTPRLRFDF
ncbi:hypothetical protein JCM10135_00160 [Stetteria hydrogenophila]